MKKNGLVLGIVLGSMLLLASGCGAEKSAGTGQSSSSAAAASSAAQTALPAEVGRQAPEVLLQGFDGQGRSLSELYKEKPLYLNFWASWCPPCVKEMPHIEGLYQKYGDKVAFAAVSVDERTEDAKAFVQKSGVTLPIYSGNNAELARGYGLDAIPVSLLIGTDGKILAKVVGGMNEKQLEAFLQPVLK